MINGKMFRKRIAAKNVVSKRGQAIEPQEVYKRWYGIRSPLHMSEMTAAMFE